MANASALRSPFRGRESAASRGFIVVVAAVLAWYTWATWGDIQIDCGREIYVPLEILRGKLLYRDIFYPYGPLAPYAGALLIAIFGPHLVAFYLFGIAVAIGCAFLLFELGTMLESRAVGLTAALALLFMGFAPGIFNYVFPLFLRRHARLAAEFALRVLHRPAFVGRPGYNLLMAGLAASSGDAMQAGVRRRFLPDARDLLISGVYPAAVNAPAVAWNRRLHSRRSALWVAIYGWFFWTLTPAFMMHANWIGTARHLLHANLWRPFVLMAIGQRFIPREMIALTMWAGVCLMLWFLLARMSQWAEHCRNCDPGRHRM